MKILEVPLAKKKEISKGKVPISCEIAIIVYVYGVLYVE